MPSRIKLRPRSTPPPPEPDAETLFIDEADSVLKSIDSNGTVTNVGSEGGAAEPGTLAEVLAQGNDAEGGPIVGLSDPVDPQDAATRQFVLDNAGGGVPLPIDEANDVYLYVGSGAPASTGGKGRQRFAVASAGDGLVYTAGGNINVPAWTALAGVVVDIGAFDPSDVGSQLTQEAAQNDWYIQNVADPVDGFYSMLWRKGAGGPTDWTIDDVYPTGSAAPVSASAAFGVGEAGPGSKYIDRSNPAGDVEWSQVGTLAAPVWTPQIASIDTGLGAYPAPTNPGIIRFVNLTFPSGDGITTSEGTYENIKSLLISTGQGAEWLGIPAPFAVRIGALFHHVLSAPTQAAGIRLRWDEVNYLFYADQPVADPDTGVITYTELDPSDTALAGAIVQMLLIAYDPNV